MSIANAMIKLLTLKRKEATLKRILQSSTLSGTVNVSSSNYFRNMEGPSSTAIKGREFIIVKAEVDLVSGFGMIKRGDRIVHPDLGELTIAEVNEMYDLGEVIIAYRCRTA